MEIKVYKPADPNVDMIQCDQWLQLLDELNIGAFTVDLHRRISSELKRAGAYRDARIRSGRQ